MSGYADPQSTHNPSTGTSPPAAWGDVIRDDIVWLAGDSASSNSKPMCRVFNSSAISISTGGSGTALTFDGERFDVGGMHSTSSNTSRITIPSGGGGVYIVGANVNFASSATGIRSVWLLLNGATRIAQLDFTSVSANTQAINLTTMYKFTATDYVEVYVYQTSGGSLNVNASGNYSPEFWAVWQGVG